MARRWWPPTGVVKETGGVRHFDGNFVTFASYLIWLPGCREWALYRGKFGGSGTQLRTWGNFGVHPSDQLGMNSMQSTRFQGLFVKIFSLWSCIWGCICCSGSFCPNASLLYLMRSTVGLKPGLFCRFSWENNVCCRFLEFSCGALLSSAFLALSLLTIVLQLSNGIK